MASPFPKKERKEMDLIHYNGRTYARIEQEDNSCFGCYFYEREIGEEEFECPVLNCYKSIFKPIDAEEEEEITSAMKIRKVRELQVRAAEEERKEAEKIAMAHLRKIDREIASAEAIVTKLRAKRQELLNRDIMDFLIEPELRTVDSCWFQSRGSNLIVCDGNDD